MEAGAYHRSSEQQDQAAVEMVVVVAARRPVVEAEVELLRPGQPATAEVVVSDPDQTGRVPCRKGSVGSGQTAVAATG